MGKDHKGKELGVGIVQQANGFICSSLIEKVNL